MLIQHFEFRTEYWERYRDREPALRARRRRRSRAMHRAASMAWIQDYHFALAAGVPARDAPVAVHPSVLAHPVSAAGHPAPAARGHARSGAARTARQRSHRISDRSLRGELSRLRRAVHPRRACRSRAPDDRVPRPRRARSARFRSASTSSGSRRWRVDARQRARASQTLRDALRDGHAPARRVRRSVDYTKGIPERIRALDTLWTESPELRERFTFIFVCTPSRTDLPAYNDARARRDAVGDRDQCNVRHRRLDADRADQRERRRRSARRASIARPTSASSRRCRTG